MGKLLDKWKMEIKKEIMEEVSKETTKIKEVYEMKLTNVTRQMEKIEVENINLIEKNSLLHIEVRKIREDMAHIEHNATSLVLVGYVIPHFYI
jgi:regulator of replication initiation timing